MRSLPSAARLASSPSSVFAIPSTASTRPVSASSSLRCTLSTVDIIAEEGLIFTTDLLNDDQPYLIETRCGRNIVSIPYTSEVNDFTVFMRQGQDVDGAFRMASALGLASNADFRQARGQWSAVHAVLVTTSTRSARVHVVIG